MAEFTPDYSRQIRLKGIGDQGQRRLTAARVLVIGAGGLGSAVLPLLAGAGVGHLTIVDHDSLEASNLHRQTLYRSDQLGQVKARLAADAVCALNPATGVAVVGHKLNGSQLLDTLHQHDLVLECTDDFKNKLMVSDAAVLLRKPAIFASAVKREGQLQTYTGEQNSACLRCLWQKVPRQLLNCEQTGVLGSVPAFIGGLQATEALQWLLRNGDGFYYQGLKNRVLLYDAATFKQRSFSLRISPECMAHQMHFDTGRYFDEHLAGDIDLEFYGTLKDAKNAGFAVIDIRDPATASQQPLSVQCRNIPAQQLVVDQRTLPHGPTLLVCFGGYTSLEVASQLRKDGFVQVYSKVGGASTP